MFQKKKVMNCSMAKKSVKRVCYSLKSHDKTLLEVSGGRRKWRRRRNICEKSRKRSKKREWEFQGDREEERFWCSLERTSGKIISLRESVMWGTPIIPCVCYYWDGRGFLAGFVRASSSFCEKSWKRSKKRRVWEFQGVSWWRGKGLMFFREI